MLWLCHLFFICANSELTIFLFDEKVMHTKNLRKNFEKDIWSMDLLLHTWIYQWHCLQIHNCKQESFSILIHPWNWTNHNQSAKKFRDKSKVRFDNFSKNTYFSCSSPYNLSEMSSFVGESKRINLLSIKLLYFIKPFLNSFERNSWHFFANFLQVDILPHMGKLFSGPGWHFIMVKDALVSPPLSNLS